MKKSSLILCGLLVVVGIEAKAGELYIPEQYQAPWVSTKTRAEVKQETRRAIAAGEVSFGDVDRPAPVASTGGRMRAEVKQETRQSLAAHEIHFGDVDLPQVATVGGVRTRAEVRAEMFAAHKAQGRGLYAY